MLLDLTLATTSASVAEVLPSFVELSSPPPPHAAKPTERTMAAAALQVLPILRFPYEEVIKPQPDL